MPVDLTPVALKPWVVPKKADIILRIACFACKNLQTGND